MGEEFDEFLEATVDIPNDVEGTMLVLQVVPERLPLNLSGVNFLWSTQYVNSAKALTLQIAQRPAQLLRLLADDMRAEIPVTAIPVSLVAELFRQVKYNRDRKAVILPRQSDDGFACFRLHICSIDNDELPCSQPFCRDEMQNLKSVVCGCLAVLVIGNKAAAEIGRKNFRRAKMLPGETRLA